MEAAVRQLQNHPSICYWTIFNEAWGQFDSTAAYRRLKEIDSSRFIDSTSGWFRGSESDVESLHIYFGMWHRMKPSQKPIVLSEFGGYSHIIDGHVWNKSKSFGYMMYNSKESLTKAYRKLFEKQIIPIIDKGLSATVYTQVSDVEFEVNGILTYDRAIVKVDEDTLKELNSKMKL
jgi:beta-galactosidase/beta-glucuronidase